MQEREASLLTVSLLSQVIQGAVNRERALTILSGADPLNVETKDATADPTDWADVAGDQGLREARKRLLSRFVPGARTRRLKWSMGSTEVIEVGEGLPLVLIHGGLGEAGGWAPILALLARRFHLYVPDRPGHGLSDPFDSRGVDMSELSATFLADVLDDCSLRTVPLVGCSMGGFTAIALDRKSVV